MPILHHNRIDVRDAHGRRRGNVVVYVNAAWDTVSFLANGTRYGNARCDAETWKLDLPRVTVECHSLSEAVSLGMAEGKRICLR